MIATSVHGSNGRPRPGLEQLGEFRGERFATEVWLVTSMYLVIVLRRRFVPSAIADSHPVNLQPNHRVAVGFA